MRACVQVWEWMDTLGIDPCFKILDPRIYPAQNRVQVCPGHAAALLGSMHGSPGCANA